MLIKEQAERCAVRDDGAVWKGAFGGEEPVTVAGEGCDWPDEVEGLESPRGVGVLDAINGTDAVGGTVKGDGKATRSGSVGSRGVEDLSCG